MSVSVEIITIGTELLLGDIVDTNAAHVARVLADHGVDVYAKHSVGDNPARLETMLRGALGRADGVIATGGLGPTVNDLTKESVAIVLGVPLERHEPSIEAMRARFAALGRTPPPNNERQAMLPQGAHVLVNPHGTAPGFVAKRGDGKFIACMPGVPAEMRPMLAEQLLPWLQASCEIRQAIYSRTLHTIGTSESELDSYIADLFATLESPKIAMLARAGVVDVKLTVKAADRAHAMAAIDPVEAEIRRRIGPCVFGVNDETLAGAITRALGERGLTLATAESVTGGAVASAIVNVPGVSAVFRGGVIAYDNDVKRSLLGVAAEAIEVNGAVSEEVAVAMAQGACRALGAEIALATTGIAGPTGATQTKPVGLVWFAVCGPHLIHATLKSTLPGDRASVRQRSVVRALGLLWSFLRRG